MALPRSLSLGQLFLAALVSCLAVLGASGIAFWRRSERAALAAAEHSREAVARSVESRVAAALGGAASVLDRVERALASGVTTPDDRDGLAALLYGELLGHARLLEVTFTGARAPASADEEGEAPEHPALAPDGRFQISVFWAPDGRLRIQRVERVGTEFREQRWSATSGELRLPLEGTPEQRPLFDPTQHPTFVASVAAAQQGAPVWSDLHFSEIDAGEPRPRAVLTVQKAVRLGPLIGVVRVGLSTTALDAIGSERIEAIEDDPHRVALLATAAAPGAPARLVTRAAADDELESIDGELRVVPRAPPAVLRELLASRVVCGLDPDRPARDAELAVEGETWLATLRPLSIAGGGTRGWAVAVLVPKSHYTRELDALGRALAVPFGASVALMLSVAAGVLVVCRRGLRGIGARTARMRDFDFSPDPGRSALAEIDELYDELERAKTVARALGKYVPIPIVRSSYERNREPALGAEHAELTILFSDIEGFTALAEKLPPAELARRLGCYFEVMTRTLEAHGATIDKYIGDAVMAFWNAPVPLAEHSARACRAVLACQRALAELYASAVWAGPALVTRFGLHRSSVLVGHFGSPSRLSYTALGDGVNLAARLESACKEFRANILVSGALVRAVGAEFDFRPRGRAPLRGKTEAVEVYELVGVARPAELESASDRLRLEAQ
jgi:adenylate cyclase